MIRKKIAFFMSSFGIGGAERQYWYLINNIDRELYDVHLILISHPKSQPKIKSYPAAHVRVFEMKCRFDLRIVFHIAAYIRENSIDLIQSQLFMDNQIARVVGLLSRRTVITSVRGGPILGWFRTRLEYGIQFITARVVVNSHWLKGILVDDGVRPEKIVVIHNGIDSVKFQCSADKADLRRKYGIPPNASVIGIVARLHPMKDHHTFLNVVRKVRYAVPGTFAVVAGAGELHSELEKYADEIGIGDVTCFLVPMENKVPEVLRMLDVFLLTSRWGESLPNVLLEAFSAAVPIVASNIHGIPEIVDDGVNGYLTEAGETERMAERVTELLSSNSTRARFIANGFEKLRGFSIAAMVGKYEDLYKETIALRQSGDS